MHKKVDMKRERRGGRYEEGEERREEEGEELSGRETRTNSIRKGGGRYEGGERGRHE